MATINRREKLVNRLAITEASFKELLVASLRRCEGGLWGMFGQNDAAYAAAYGSKRAARFESKDGAALLDLVGTIDELRGKLGYTSQNPLCASFLHYRNKRDSNDQGEPKLATILLAEIADLDRASESHAESKA